PMSEGYAPSHTDARSSWRLRDGVGGYPMRRPLPNAVTPLHDTRSKWRHGWKDPERPGGYWYDMRFSKLTTAATLTLTLTWQVTLANEPSATDRCMRLMSGDGLVEEAITVCAEAAKESREGLVLYGDILS